LLKVFSLFITQPTALIFCDFKLTLKFIAGINVKHPSIEEDKDNSNNKSYVREQNAAYRLTKALSSEINANHATAITSLV
jgi:hypothetical protein